MDKGIQRQRRRDLYQSSPLLKSQRLAIEYDQLILKPERINKIRKLSQTLIQNISDDKTSLGLYFHSPPGRGKTTTAIRIALDIYQAGKTVWATSTADLKNNLKDPDDGFKYMKNLFTKFKYIDCILLDDIEHGKTSEWFEENLKNFLDKVGDHNITLLITSNKKASSLDFSHPIVSRIQDLTNEVQFRGEDLRRKHNKTIDL